MGLFASWHSTNSYIFVKPDIKRANKRVKQPFFACNDSKIRRKTLIQGILEVNTSKVQSFYCYRLFLNETFSLAMCNFNIFNLTLPIFNSYFVFIDVVCSKIQVQIGALRYHDSIFFQEFLCVYIRSYHILEK